MSHVQFVLEEPPSMTTEDMIWMGIGVVSFAFTCFTLAPKVVAYAKKHLVKKKNVL